MVSFNVIINIWGFHYLTDKDLVFIIVIVKSNFSIGYSRIS